MAASQKGTKSRQPQPDGSVLHVYVTEKGEVVTTIRDLRGRLLPGSRLTDLATQRGVEPTTPAGIRARALGLVTAHNRADKKRSPRRKVK